MVILLSTFPWVAAQRNVPVISTSITKPLNPLHNGLLVIDQAHMRQLGNQIRKSHGVRSCNIMKGKYQRTENWSMHMLNRSGKLTLAMSWPHDDDIQTEQHKTPTIIISSMGRAIHRNTNCILLQCHFKTFDWKLWSTSVLRGTGFRLTIPVGNVLITWEKEKQNQREKRLP